MTPKANVYALLGKYRKHLAQGGDLTLFELDALKKELDLAFGSAPKEVVRSDETPPPVKKTRPPKKLLFAKKEASDAK